MKTIIELIKRLWFVYLMAAFVIILLVMSAI